MFVLVEPSFESTGAFGVGRRKCSNTNLEARSAFDSASDPSTRCHRVETPADLSVRVSVDCES